MRAVHLFVGLVLCWSTAGAQDWDVPGVQGNAGLIVYSGVGEPLALRVVPMRDSVLMSMVAMRIEHGTELLRIQMSHELSSFDGVMLPECSDTARVIILTGRDFESEFFEVDTVVLQLMPSPVRLSITEAELTRVPGENTLLVKGLRQIKPAQSASGASTDLEFTLENVAVEDASGERLRLSVIGSPEQTSSGGSIWEYALTLRMDRTDGRPPFGRISGTFDVVMGGVRIVCGRRSMRRSLRKSFELR